MTLEFDAVIESPVGCLGLRMQGRALLGIEFIEPTHEGIHKNSASKVVSQLQQYFDRPGFEFDLELVNASTLHQRQVRLAMQAIPQGQVQTYGQVAESIGSCARAVGGACRNNPIPIVVPCHRVVSASGWGGYSGATEGKTLDIKRWLLAHEGVERVGE